MYTRPIKVFVATCHQMSAAESGARHHKTGLPFLNDSANLIG